MFAKNRKAAAISVAVARCWSLCLGILPGGQAPAAAQEWNFYMHQSAPNFATSRGAKLFTEEIEKATGGELKVRLHLAGTLQINASNITQAVGENVVQIGDDLFNSGNIAVATLITGHITVIAPDGRVLRQVNMPDVYPTNICFGGRDMKTAYITLSASGQLAAMDWPEPGLRLNFQE